MPEEDFAVDGNRLTMAQEQKELIEALLCRGPHPPGFDSARLQLASEALIRKRIRCMQRAHILVQEICLRDDHSMLAALHQFIRENPSVHPQGPYFDALAFLSYLRQQGVAKPAWGRSIAFWMAAWKAVWKASWTAIRRPKQRKVAAIDQTIN